MNNFIVACAVITSVLMILTEVIEGITTSINKRVETKELLRKERRLSYIRRASEQR
ncbi:hypothetical protein MK516_07405 [Streptococcus gallolyticus subsp. gallolyticus]|uniref:hypothetical protein n=1 Tax=Streptococcus gallolyticus TaxID=315405 RepID=UPI002284B5D2|nr:hypothetical protein [Streptococcus gallolyticus]MCY7172349.1 hypothetical protein [Streptococcus gallolyticus subsp. gallolyticus]